MKKEDPSCSIVIVAVLMVLVIFFCVARTECEDVVLEGALMLDVGAAEAEPELAVVLLVGVPVALDSKGLGALTVAGEGLDTVLVLVVRLQRISGRAWACIMYYVQTKARLAVEMRGERHGGLLLAEPQSSLASAWW